LIEKERFKRKDRKQVAKQEEALLAKRLFGLNSSLV